MLAKLLTVIENSTINGKIAKNIFEEMIDSPQNPEIIVEKKGLTQLKDYVMIKNN